jgi:hypothetical protein
MCRCWIDIALLIVQTFTLIVLVIYAIYTAKIARDPWKPLASCSLQSFSIPHETILSSPSISQAKELEQPDQYFIVVIIQNLCKMPLTFWLEINARIKDVPISYGGFYDGKSTYNIQPYGNFQCRFKPDDLLKKYREEKNDQSQLREKDLRFQIDFYYSKDGKKPAEPNWSCPYYYDFSRNVVVPEDIKSSV